jgi:ankyrin repeat protein
MTPDAPPPPSELPVHVAAAAGVSGPELEALLLAHPGATGAEDSQGLLPLHHAAAHGHAPTTQLLVVAHAPGVHHRAVGGLLPLHLACQCSADALEVVTLLLEAGPEAATSPDRRGRLPLHVAASCGAATAVVRALLAANRRASTALDAAGQTPAHCAATRVDHADTLALLLDVNPQVCESCTCRV